MKRFFPILLLLACSNLAWSDSDAPVGLRIEVRSSQSLFEPFSNDEPLEIYLRSTAPGYLTLYQIHPDSGLAILYPQPHHHWRELEDKKEYRLSDLAKGLELDYPGFEGYVHLGVIITKEPIHIVPWLEQAFGEKGLKIGQKPENFFEKDLEAVIEKVESDLRFRMGEANTSSFALIPLLMRSRAQLYAGDWREPPKPQRYFFEGRYHVVAPEPPRNFPAASMRAPSPFPRHAPLPGARAAAPQVTKEETNKVKPSPRREKK